jgi:excinuclease UvrABC helicase subunit UvrB
VDIINDYKNKDMLKEDFENLKFKINQIGEPIIRTRLLEMCRDLKVVEKKEEPNPEKNIEKSNKSLSVLEKELKAAVKMENFEKALTLKKEIDFLKSNQ